MSKSRWLERCRTVGGRTALGLALVAGAVVTTFPLATVASATPGWSAPTAVDNTTPGNLLAVSCPTATFCMAIDSDRDCLTYNGHTWSAPTFVSTPAGMVTLSCASKTLCAATDGDGDVFTYNGHTWSAPDNVDGGTYMSGVSCAPATTFCVAVAGDTGGDGYIYSGGSWSSQIVIDSSASPGMDGISCVTASYCAATDPQGNVVSTSNGGSTWTAPDPVDETGATPEAISCYSADSLSLSRYVRWLRPGPLAGHEGLVGHDSRGRHLHRLPTRWGRRSRATCHGRCPTL